MAPRKVDPERAAEANAAVDAFVGGLLRQAVATARVASKAKLEALARRIEAAVDREVAKAFPLIASRLVGVRSQRSRYRLTADRLNQGGSAFTTTLNLNVRSSRIVDAIKAAKRPHTVLAHWEALSQFTVKEKGNDLFFVRTGKLRDFLAKVDAGAKLGKTKATLHLDPSGGSPFAVGPKIEDRAILGRMTVSVFPALPGEFRRSLAVEPGTFRADPTTKLENKLFGPTYRAKLAPPQRRKGSKYRIPQRYRALVPPVLHWFLTVKVPQAVAAAARVGTVARGPGSKRP